MSAFDSLASGAYAGVATYGRFRATIGAIIGVIIALIMIAIGISILTRSASASGIGTVAAVSPCIDLDPGNAAGAVRQISCQISLTINDQEKVRQYR